MRPNWNQYFMEFARLAAKRSTCVRRSVGAVLVRDRMILSTGYNGAPKGVGHCTNDSCIRRVRDVPSGKMAEVCMAVHAEQNVIAQAAYHGIETKDSVLYSTTKPCVICLKILINAGVKKVYYEQPYNDQIVDNLVKISDIELIHYGSDCL